MDGCSWPLVAAYVPGTNLMLIAVYKLCDGTAGVMLPSVPDPLINEPVNMTEGTYVSRRPIRATEKLACWRNRTPLPGRPPNLACFSHNYTQEEGYRQCGPWIPDPDQD
ncbi:hypothetical protein EVAR_89293_1 [Eumeta japonica]|uniref:Uncharacterized protein n=1 Tax=Eumeta variegata TaxID=151549 RepID=A0A4C1YYI2_EUMVA|nr:hypothetical protein EVAR_89293_1 [Eumeta japonica]